MVLAQISNPRHRAAARERANLRRLLQWEGQDGACKICGKLVSEHPDWVLPDRVVKYCNGK